MESSNQSQQLERYSQDLFDAVVRDAPSWITRRVNEILRTSNASDIEKVISGVDGVAIKTQQFVSDRLFKLLSEDVDMQRSNPLHILRSSSVFANQLLKEANVAQVHRDEFDKSALPDDVYAIGPLTWRDLSDDVHEVGITWGAWKAATILQRRRSEGKELS